MIYLKQIAIEQQVLVPVDGITTGSGDVVLSLLSTVDRTWQDVGSLYAVPISGIYATFSITLPEGCATGSYEYRVKQDGQVLAEGVAQVGDYPNPQSVQYNNDVQYEQYEQSE